ncbi:hypothetical protein [Ekhidna sp. To15]|uniref:hypothetical protein n=1 Tax=Ekhidna sp. To15 TaxID=3395267 RepID=UPI003F526CAC
MEHIDAMDLMIDIMKLMLIGFGLMISMVLELVSKSVIKVRFAPEIDVLTLLVEGQTIYVMIAQ